MSFRLPLVAAVCWLLVSPLVAEEKPKDSFTKWEPEIRKFEQSDETKPPAAGGVVFTGSSSIRLWNLEKSFPGQPGINRGFGGSQMVDAAHFAPRIVLPYHPRTVVVYSGDNDIKNGKSPEEVAGDFKSLADTVHESLPSTKIVYLPIKPSPSRWSLIEKQRAANKLIQDYAATTSYITSVDVGSVLMGPNGEPDRSLFKEDMLHLNDKGYERWTAVLGPALQLISAPSAVAEGKTLTDSRFKPLRTYGDGYHPWTPPTSREAWEKEAEKIRKQLLVACGLWPMPAKEPLKPVIHGKVERDDFTVERVFFQSRPGLYCTGSLFRPKKIEGKIPVVLCPHGHWANGRFYDAGDKGAAEQLKMGAESRESGAHSPLQARMIHLTRMGCTVFFYDMIGRADQKPLDHSNGFNDAEASLQLQNYLGLQTWNSIRALDFVLSLPEADPTRVGVTGASGGGTQTFMLFAVDPRPTVAFPAVMVSTAMQGGCVCENSDYLRTGINNIAITALTAPRPLGMVGADDWTIDIETKGLPELQQVYGLFGQKDLVAAKTYKQFPHNYNEKSRELMYAWFAKYLKLGENAPLKESDFKPLTQEELTVFTADHPLPADALPAEKLRAVMTAESNLSGAATVAKPESRADYLKMVRSAADVMLDSGVPATDEVEIEHGDVSDIDDRLIRVTAVVRRKASQEAVPASAVRPKEGYSGTIVLWLDDAGKASLFDLSGQPKPAVRKLANRGMAVASIDLFLTGESRTAAEAQQSENQKGKPLYAVNATFPGYTFGYNRPLVSQRVRDVLATIAATRLHDDTKRVVLVGTGKAGVVALLAAAIAGSNVDETIVDVGGFSFDEIKSPQDELMLPGAKKYGGLGALAALAAPQKLTVYGMSEGDGSRLTSLYGDDAKSLTVEKASPTIEELVEKIGR
jgi:dienelactone hydrolase/lysophospholipase L1-like esterase